MSLLFARLLPAVASSLVATLLFIPAVAEAAKATDCAKVGLCYCIDDAHKAAITAKIDRFRQVIAEQRKAGKAIVYLSVPVSAAGGGNFKINQEVAESVTNDMAKLDAFFDKRVASDPDFAKAVQGGLTKPAFRRYYALRASATVSRGAHDEWNIFRLVNDKRRADAKIGTPGQIAIVFDGQSVAPPQHEATVSDGYVGKSGM